MLVEVHSQNVIPPTEDDLKELLCILVQSQCITNDMLLGVSREKCLESHVNVKQLRAVDVSRITNKQGALEKRYLEPIKAALGIVFDL